MELITREFKAIAHRWPGLFRELAEMVSVFVICGVIILLTAIVYGAGVRVENRLRGDESLAAAYQRLLFALWMFVIGAVLTLASGCIMIQRAVLERHRGVVGSKEVGTSSGDLPSKDGLDGRSGKQDGDVVRQKNEGHIVKQVDGRRFDDVPSGVFALTSVCGLMLWVAGARRARRSISKQKQIHNDGRSTLACIWTALCFGTG